MPKRIPGFPPTHFNYPIKVWSCPSFRNYSEKQGSDNNIFPTESLFLIHKSLNKHIHSIRKNGNGMEMRILTVKTENSRRRELSHNKN